MGHRSLAEMYANEFLSEVAEGAADVKMAFSGLALTHTGLRIVFHVAISTASKNGRRNALYSWVERSTRRFFDEPVCDGGVGGALSRDQTTHSKFVEGCLAA